jgi:Skp family chaperone for outer membrane proteins
MGSRVNFLRLAKFSCLMGLSFSAPLASAQDFSEATASIHWIQTFECPQPGYPMLVPGLEDDNAISVQKEISLSFAERTESDIARATGQRNAALAEISRSGRAPGSKTSRALEELELSIGQRVADAGVALVQWVLADYVALSRTENGFDPGRSGDTHPLAARLQELEKLLATTDRLTALPKYQEFIAPVPAAYKVCLGAVQAALADQHKDYIAKITGSASTSQEIDAMRRRFEAFPWQTLNVAEPPPLAAARTRQEELSAIERARDEAEREKLRQQAEARQRAQQAEQDKRRQEDARRQEEERQRLIAAARPHVPNASSFGFALRNRDLSLASSVLSDNVVMTAPDQPSRVGRAEVENALASRFTNTSDPVPTISDPQIDSSGRIYIVLSASGRTAYMYLSFSPTSLITSINIVN